ncbi:polyribonucleotide nucleotidyltransferase [Candidatus Roizmanbacteria bacterium CG10_big_fil_rev_8_21_14_0_10_45_7]|uniref:Polyribonucleotide nucleotidyltransferase n=1 Tax=Candidatus Roizmanbacteria bacterium CG10_big_fil_rev_8_21_14_0_10_45_7 TaxID=1974854 RepID=A0A2M8KVN1_9BACT|nr:MAG: polyribonucleotide nucleotidyltransferase [Candidatus Roizmanbacteria bacterium CG10_big_fil_rev_8_21_14_0_10_45_7]
MKSHTKIIESSTGKTLTFRWGGFAQQATSAVMTQYGETTILTTVVIGKENNELDYFPLSIEYLEKLYAGGRIKGSRWVKREGRPTDSAVLVGRLIDRSVRPLFDEGFRRDVQIINTLLSVDGVTSPEIVAALSTACALSLCPIPWKGPIATTKIGLLIANDKKEGHLIVNPTPEEEQLSHLELVVSSTKDEVVMIESRAEEVSNDIMVKGIERAKKENAVLISLFEEIRTEEKITAVELPKNENDAIAAKIVKKYETELKAKLEKMADKENVDSSGDELFTKIMEEFELDEKGFKKILPIVFKKITKILVFKEGRRADGRKFDEIRPLEAEVGVLPRIHGSALFRRGATQVLSVATLGPLSQRQWVENPEGEFIKNYIHHYYMPPYSVGETGRMGSPSRREIGHGALAEKAIEPLLPVEDDFPYTTWVVSEVLSSNGSTSMASTCGSSLALMDAGVPIKAAVGGIAIGIVRESQEKYQLLTDIIGIEDFFGEMDFKVAGTRKGITAIQLDVKKVGLTSAMIAETIERAGKARMTVLDVMDKAIAKPRSTVSKYAPRIVILTPPEDKIGEIIGPGGKNIKRIIAETGAEVDIDERGKVSISSPDADSIERAVAMVQEAYKVYALGEEYPGTVVKVLPFGGVVQIASGKEGLLHVSQMGMGFVKDANEVLKEGQELRVKISEIDDRGRMKFALVK